MRQAGDATVSFVCAKARRWIRRRNDRVGRVRPAMESSMRVGARRLRVACGLGLIAWAFVLASAACSGGFARPIGGPDSGESPTDGRSSDRADVSSGGRRAADDPHVQPEQDADDGEFDGQAPSPNEPAPAGRVQCGETTCAAVDQFCCSDLFSPWPRLCSDSGNGCAISMATALACDDPHDCHSPLACLVSGRGLTIRSSCGSYQSGWQVSEPAKPPALAWFQLWACDPDASPSSHGACPGNLRCRRQECHEFAFNLCGEIPDGACGPYP